MIGVLGGRHGDECLCFIRYVHSLLLRLLRNEPCTPDETLTTVRLAVAHAVGVDREAVRGLRPGLLGCTATGGPMGDPYRGLPGRRALTCPKPPSGSPRPPGAAILGLC